MTNISLKTQKRCIRNYVIKCQVRNMITACDNARYWINYFKNLCATRYKKKKNALDKN